ncbi:hypothetical protein GYMLUDRAFT_239707 [Collybiopsis luxurians FD-317 M1]|nr:hypothetical protein GYMLUDRAFT_239707 [Collybiopsis luxurians FD-317 M1]
MYTGESPLAEEVNFDRRSEPRLRIAFRLASARAAADDIAFWFDQWILQPLPLYLDFFNHFSLQSKSYLLFNFDGICLLKTKGYALLLDGEHIKGQNNGTQLADVHHLQDILKTAVQVEPSSTDPHQISMNENSPQERKDPSTAEILCSCCRTIPGSSALAGWIFKRLVVLHTSREAPEYEHKIGGLFKLGSCTPQVCSSATRSLYDLVFNTADYLCSISTYESVFRVLYARSRRRGRYRLGTSDDHSCQQETGSTEALQTIQAKVKATSK